MQTWGKKKIFDVLAHFVHVAVPSFFGGGGGEVEFEKTPSLFLHLVKLLPPECYLLPPANNGSEGIFPAAVWGGGRWVWGGRGGGVTG